MAPVYSDLKVHLRPDRSITQFMLENVCNTDPLKVILEDTLTDKCATYGGIREEAFRAANSLRTSYGLRQGDTVSIISRSCVSFPVSELSGHVVSGRTRLKVLQATLHVAKPDRWITFLLLTQYGPPAGLSGEFLYVPLK